MSSYRESESLRTPVGDDGPRSVELGGAQDEGRDARLLQFCGDVGGHDASG